MGCPDIIRYLDEMYPSQTPLWPKDPYTKAKMKVWVDHVTSRILPAYHRFVLNISQDGTN
jgi:glutathione S-transferase